jgi:hypothetical protein
VAFRVVLSSSELVSPFLWFCKDIGLISLPSFEVTKQTTKSMSLQHELRQRLIKLLAAELILNNSAREIINARLIW